MKVLDPDVDVYLTDRYYKYLVYYSEFKVSRCLLSVRNIISLDSFLTKELPIMEVCYLGGYQVNKNRGTGDLSIGCQAISAANLKKIFSSLKKKIILCDLFEDRDTIVSIIPEKNKVLVGMSEEMFIIDMDEIAEFKAMLDEK